jgi:hypothetical protein
MALNRREFVQLGAVGTAGILSASCTWPWGKPPASALQVNIKGLILVERFPQSVTVHLVDAAKVGLMTAHEPFLAVPASLIDSSATSAPSQPDPQDATLRLFALTNKTLTLDASHSGGPALEFNDDPIDENVPPDDDHWKSVKFSARLSTLCGATKIIERGKFASSLAIEHGRLHSIKPDTLLGRQQVWQFTRKMTSGPDQKVVKQVMTNTLVCDVPVQGTSATFLIGTQPLVLNLSSPGAVTLRNLPPHGTIGMCKATVPCVDHMEVFYDLVDSVFRPTAQPANIVATGPGAEPDYCPPGTV